MAACILAAGLMVLAFPLRWSTAWRRQQAAAAAAQAEVAAGPAGSAAAGSGARLAAAASWRAGSARRSSRLLFAAAYGDALLACPESVRSRALPELEAAAAGGRAGLTRAATHHGGGLSPWGSAAADRMERAITF